MPILLLLFQQKGTTMGKHSSYPSYTGGVVSINGQKIASAKKKNGAIQSSYNMNPSEKAIFDFAQQNILNSLPNVNVFSQDTVNAINSQLDAYRNSGINEINNVYLPMINSLKNDIASRFGNLNNSVFMNNLNSIESQRANAISNLANNLLTQRSNLYDEELQRRYGYLSFLSNLQNQINNTALSYLQLAQSGSNAGNSYNQQAYNNSSGGFFSDPFKTVSSLASYASLFI